MNFSEEMGVKIDDRVRSMLLNGAQACGSKRQFAQECGCPASAITQWLADGKRKGEYITWGVWKGVRECLSRHGLLDADEPRWLLPSELLAELERLRQERGGSATASGAGSAAASGAGARATAAPVNQTTASEAEAVRKLERLASWIIACPDLSPEAKLRAMAIIHPD